MTLLTGIPKTKGKFAFTLVEVMTAVLILSAGIVFVLGSFSKIISGARTERDYTIGLTLLKSKIWEIARIEELEGGLEVIDESGTFPDFDKKYSFRLKTIDTDISDDLTKVEYRVDWGRDESKRAILAFGLAKKK